MRRGEDPSREWEEGFSLVELMVVMLVIAILIGVGFPTLAGARERAGDRVAQANVRTAFAATRVFYNEGLRYTDDPASMTAVEPGVVWTTADLDGSSPRRSVGISVYDQPAAGQTVVIVGRTKTGRCFYLKDVMGGKGEAGTFYQADVSGAASCPVPDPATINDLRWS